MRKRLGECLVHAGLISEDELRIALVEQKQTREPLGVILTRQGVASECQIAQTVALQLGVPFVDLAQHEPDPATLSVIPQPAAVQHAAVALTLQRHVLTVALADPLLLGFLHDLESRTGYRVRPVVAARSDVSSFIARAYSSSQSDSGPVAAAAADDDEESHDIEAELTSLVERIRRRGVTEVRLEPTRTGGLISQREDGRLQPVAGVSRSVLNALVARLKRRACMDPGERRLAQDGRLRFSGADGDGTIQVMTRRVSSGELAVLRPGGPVLSLPLPVLGLSPSALETLRALSSRSGLLLLSAPPAHGASTSARSIAEACRAVDFGEIDDSATAGAALTAAREGTLIIATIQAEDTGAAVDRLIGLSWSPGLVAEVIVGVVAQRLVRRLCDRCRRPSDSAEGFEAAGCGQCGYTGYRGRVGLFEVLPVEAAGRHLIAQSGTELRDAALAAGMVALAEDGLSKVRAGVVRFADVSRSVSGLASARRSCPACGRIVDEERADCASCGQRLLGTCPFCGRALRREWGTCPYCARSVLPGTAARRLS